MELEVGLKLTRTRDDISSVSELRIAKDRAGPVFLSRETNAMFILTAHLKGYKKNNINIKISEDGRDISISGEKPIQEVLMMRWVMLKNHEEITGFSKVFKIPDGVLLDRIKAKYNEDESVLKIVMPKLVKGISGVQIEEVKEEEIDRGRSKLEQSEANIGESSQEASEDSRVQQMVENERVKEKEEIGKQNFEIEDVKEEEIDRGRSKLEQSEDDIGESSQEAYEDSRVQQMVENERVMEKEEIGKQKFEIEDVKEEEIDRGRLKLEQSEADIGESSQEAFEDSRVQQMVENERVVEKEEFGKQKFEIENVKEEEIDGGRSKLEQSEADIGKSSQEEFEDSRVQQMVENERVMEKEEIEKQKFEIEDVKKEEIDKERSKLEQSEADIGESSQEAFEDSRVQQMVENERVMEKEEIGKQKFEIEDGYEAMKNSEIEKNLEEHIPKNIEETSAHVSENAVIQNLEGECEDRYKERVEEQISQEEIETMNEGKSEKALTKVNGFSGEDNNGRRKKEKVEEPKFETKEKDEERVEEEVSKEEIDRMEEGKSKEVLAKVNRVGREDNNGGTKKEEMEEPKFENKERDEERVEEGISNRGIEKIEEGKFEKVSREDNNGGAMQKEIEGAKFEIEDEDKQRVEEKISKVGIERMEEGKFDKVSREDSNGRTMQKEMEEPEFENEDKDKERVNEEISNEGFEAKKNIGKDFDSKASIDVEESESMVERIEGGSEKVLARAKQKEIEEPKFETEDKDKEMAKEEISEEGFEADENRVRECPNVPKISVEKREGLKVAMMEESKELKEAMIKRENQEANGATKEDIIGGTKQEKFEEPKFDIVDKDKESMQKDIIKEGSQAIETAVREFPKKVPKSPIEESATSKVLNIEEIERVKAVMAKSENQEIEGFKEEEGEKSKKMNEKAGKVIEKEQKGIEEFSVKTSGDEQNVPKNIVKRVFEVLGTIISEFPKQKVETKAKREKEEMARVKVKGEVFIKMHDEANEGFEKDIIGDKIQKETGESSFGLKDSDQLRGLGNVDKGGFDVSKREESKVIKEEIAEAEHSVEKVKGENKEKVPVGAYSGSKKDMTSERTQKEKQEPNIETKKRDQQCVQEEASKTKKEEFSMQIAESIENKREGPKDEKIEEMAKRKSVETEVVADDKPTLKEKIQETEIERMRKIKQITKIFEEVPEEKKDLKALEKDNPERKMQPTKDMAIYPKVVARREETKVAKEKSTETKHFVEKVKGDNKEKVQVEAYGGFKKDMVGENTQEEKEESKVGTKDRDQQCVQEEISEGMFEASKTAKEEFSMQIVESIENKKEGPKDKKIEVAKRKNEEIGVMADDEPIIKEKMQETEIERMSKIKQITKTSREVSKEEKDVKALEKDRPKREVQPTKDMAIYPKIMRFKEVEQGGANDKLQKEELLCPKIQSKETLESEKGSVNQDIVKRKEAKEIGEKEKSADRKESTKPFVAEPFQKPSIPSTHQLEAKEKGKESQESTERDLQTNFQDCIKMKENQESKHRETLQPQFSLEEHPKKEDQVTTKDAIHRGQKVEESIQDNTEEPKNEIDDRDKKNVQTEVEKGVGSTKKMPKDKYEANVGAKVGRMEIKNVSQSTLEREKRRTVRNIEDEKSRIKKGVQKFDIEKEDKVEQVVESMQETPEKELPKKSKEEVKREVEPPDAEVAYPEAASMKFKEVKPKNDIEEPQMKELPTPSIEMQSKEPFELEKKSMKKKISKTKNCVPEAREEGIQAPTVIAYQATKQSEVQRLTPTQKLIVEEKEKSDRANDKQKSKIDFQESKERIIQKEVATLQPHILTGQSFEEKEKVDGKLQEAIQEGTKDFKILTEERGQQYMLQNLDEKGFEMKKVPEEEKLNRKHGAKILPCKNELAEPRVKQAAPKVEIGPQLQEDEESIYSFEGTKTSEDMANEVDKPSNFSSQPSIQQCDIKEKGKTDECYEGGHKEYQEAALDFQESAKRKLDQEVEQTKTSKPEFPMYPQIIRNSQEIIEQKESHGRHGIEEENFDEGGETHEDSYQELEILEDIEVEASEEKKDNAKRSKRLCAPLVISGSAFLVSLIVFFVHHRKAGKRYNLSSNVGREKKEVERSQKVAILN